MAGTVLSLYPQFCPTTSDISKRTAASCFVGQTHIPVLNFSVCHNGTSSLDCEVRLFWQRSRCYSSKNSTTNFVAACKWREARPQSSSCGVIRAGSLGGRFPQTPVHLPANPPIWLQVAREQMRIAGKVEEFRKKVQRDWAEKEKYTASFPLKSLEERVQGRQFSINEAENEPWFLMELSIHRTYSEAYELEAEGLGFCSTGIKSVFSVPQGHQISRLAELWSFQSGLRFVMEPLVVAQGPEELIASITDLQLKKNLQQFCLSHDKLAPSTNRLCRKELRSQVGVAIGNTGSCGFGTEWAPDRPRFAITEISTGYIFGHVIYAPGPMMPSYRFAPHRWSAGIPEVLASIAVNIAGSAGDKLVDPCCGLGTILFEANRRGLQADGSDISLGTLVNTANNCDYFKIPYTRAWGDFCSIFGPHNPRTKNSSPSASPWSPELSVPINSLDTSAVQSNSLADLLQVKTRMVSGALEQVETAGEIGRLTTSVIDQKHDETKYCDPVQGINGLEEYARHSVVGSAEYQSQLSEDSASIPTQCRRVLTGTIRLAIADARTVDFEADCVVTNFPFGRFLTLEEGSIESILLNLKGRAKRYVFFFGAPLSPFLTHAGFHLLREVSVCQHNKRFMAICTSEIKCKDRG